MRPGERATLAQERLAAGLAMLAGYVDGYGILAFQTYLSFMSGNTTQTGYKLGQAALAAAVPSALAIVSFVAGVFLGTLLTHPPAGNPRRRVFAVAAAAVAGVLVVSRVGALPDAAGIVTLSLAMGMLNTTLARVSAEGVSLTFVTGTLNKIGTHLALAVRRAPLPDAAGPRDSHFRRAALLAGVWAAFLTGAVLAGAATPHFGAWVLLPPALALAALAVFAGG